jgi:hypothetical protein
VPPQIGKVSPRSFCNASVKSLKHYSKIFKDVFIRLASNTQRLWAADHKSLDGNHFTYLIPSIVDRDHAHLLLDSRHMEYFKEKFSFDQTLKGGAGFECFLKIAWAMMESKFGL